MEQLKQQLEKKLEKVFYGKQTFFFKPLEIKINQTCISPPDLTISDVVVHLKIL